MLSPRVRRGGSRDRGALVADTDIRLPPRRITEIYTYDEVGNRLSSIGLAPYTYNESNHLLSTPAATYTYDNNGNLTSKTDAAGTTTYEWDVENRLVAVHLPSGGAVNFSYDPFGRWKRENELRTATEQQE